MPPWQLQPHQHGHRQEHNPHIRGDLQRGIQKPKRLRQASLLRYGTPEIRHGNAKHKRAKDQPQRDERDDAQADCHGEAVLAHHREEAEVEGQHGDLSEAYG